jgi:hypothetical protein
MHTLNAVPIRTPFVDWILDGHKTWEIRSRSTNIRGRIGQFAILLDACQGRRRADQRALARLAGLL